MLIAKIKQSGQVITLEDKLTTFQYSANLQMRFVKDTKYKDYILTGWYRRLKGTEYLLDIDKDGIFTLSKDVFEQRGTVEFSFSLNNPADGEIIHLGVIEYVVEQSFGSGDAILPEEQDTWIQVVSRVVEDQVPRIWDKDYKPQLEQNLNIIEAKTEEIKTSAMEVKQDALESSANAKSALDNANLAKESASGAILAKEKALEHMSNAEGFKNDASNYASQANLAKTEASKSVTNANNSASNALDSANKAKEHLDNVNSKVNTFNAEYTNKVNSFNSNVEQANNTLDAKIEKANTDIDKKVLDANNALDTKIADANTSIDAKVKEATEQAYVATTKATELKDAVDKVNYLEDVVDTKLTQPYVSSPAIENVTISDSDEGQLRNLRVYGKCTQKVETGIVPTPDRPVPIVSKKIVVGGETVELRSLKESVNLFDLGLLSKTELIPKVGAYRKIDIPLILKPSTKYTFSYDSWEVPALSWIVLKIINTDDTTLAGVFNYKNTSTEAQVKDKINVTFTTDFTGKTYFSYYVSEFNEDGSSIPQVTETFKKLWYTDLLNNIMLVEGVNVPSTYVAPTVRDYKVVDHVNKRSWIERNVIQKNLVNLNPQKIEHNKFIVTYVYTMSPNGKDGSWNNIFCNNFAIYPYSGFPADIKEGIHVSNYGIYIALDDKRNVTTIEEYKEWIKDNPIIVNYQLATPSIEQIEYSESDISEFGQSFQDTTSPSPTIKSEAETISTLNIKVCNINLLDNKLEHWYFRKTLGWGASTGTPVPKPDTFRDTGNFAVIEINNILPNTRYSFYNADTKNLWVSRIIEMDSDYIGYYNHRLYDKVEIDNKEFYAFTTSVHTTKLFLQIRTSPITGNGASRDIEEKDIANMQITLALDEVKKHYNYLETVVSHTLAKPLLSIKDYRDTINLNTKERENCIWELPKELLTTNIQLSIYKKMTNCIRFGIYNSKFLPHILHDTEAVSCNMFKTLKTPWGHDVESIHIHDGYTMHLYISVNKNRLAGYNDNLTDAEIVNLFKEFIQNADIRIWWVLAEPITEPLETELVEKLKTLMSFYPITHIISNAPLSFDYKLNLENWHKVVSGEVENAKDVIYNMQVQQNNLEVMQLESSLNMQYNLDLMKLGGI